MKKTAAALLALMLTLSLAACSKQSAPDTTDPSAPSQSENNRDDTTTDKNELTFTEIVAVDNPECLIRITGVEPDTMWGFALKAQLENRSADKTYMFAIDSAAINGVQCDPLFAAEVAPLKKSTNDIHFPTDTLNENGVGEYTDIELTFRVYDSDDWSADPVAMQTIHIYPFGEDKATNFVRNPQASDNVLVDNEAVSVIVTGYEEDDIWGYTVELFLVNKTDKAVMFAAEDASVNGFMADPYYATSVSPGKCAFSSMAWSDSELEKNGIAQIEQIEFLLRVFYEDDWFGDDIVSQSVTLHP